MKPRLASAILIAISAATCGIFSGFAFDDYVLGRNCAGNVFSAIVMAIYAAFFGYLNRKLP